MSMTLKTWTWAAGLIFLLAAPGWAQPAADDTTTAGEEKKYRAPLEGFALTPPAGGLKTAQRIPAILAQWTKQEPKTGETLWTLRVYRTTFRNRKANVRDYAEAVRESLKLRAALEVDDLNFIDMGGIPAIQITGRTRKKVVTDGTGMESKVPSTELRQMWFLRGPGEFLVMDFVTVGDRLAWTNRMWETLLDSVELFDAGVYLLEQEKRLKRAAIFLNGLTGEAIQSALPRTPQWFLIQKNDTPVGWLCMQGRPVRRNRVAGYEIRSWAMFRIPNQPVRLIQQAQFTNPDMTMGLWSGRVQFGSGQQSALLVEDGLRQENMIIATLTDGQRVDNEKKMIPEKMFGMYLPRAVGTLLPSLLDRTKPAGYTFAEYDRQVNDFQIRTVTVVGPERIDVNGKFVRAVKITDQPMVDSEPLTFWVDENGKVLQSRSPDGLLSVSVRTEDVLRVFPNARAVIAKMNQIRQKTPQTPTKRPAKRRAK